MIKTYLRMFYLHAGSLFFTLTGRKPWKLGYYAYKELTLEKVLSRRIFSTDSLPTGYGFRLDERIIEYPWFLSRLPSGPGHLLDAGSVLNNSRILAIPLIAEKKLFISTLAPESVAFWRKGVSYVYEDIRNSCYRDGFFDWIVSLSTLEHVGFDNSFLYTRDGIGNEHDPQSYVIALRELHRILRPAGSLFLSVPFGRKKDHGWFQVFDSNMIDTVIETFQPVRVSETHFRYDRNGWKVSSREDSRDATCFDIHVQRHYDEDYAAFSRGIVCLELVK